MFQFKRRLFALALMLATIAGAPAFAQEETGSIVGTVLDNTNAEPIPGVEVALVAPDGSEQAQTVSGADGVYRFEAVQAGNYSIRFAKPGYGAARMTEFPVLPNQLNPGDFAISPETTADSSGVEEIVITAERKLPVADRTNASEFLNTMDTAEIAKFAASDIGEAIKRIPGINVVEGQFAIIRGLEDRYSSTLYNSAPVPSPDPNTQSVQLDLFPSEVASNLVVAKTFAPDLPGNSGAGSINIITNDYAEGPQLKLSLGTGFNEKSVHRFVHSNHGSPIGSDVPGNETLESDVGLSFGASTQLAGREVRIKASVSHEVDYDTRTGVQENREPRAAQRVVFPTPSVTRSGDLALGRLSLTGGSFDLIESGEIKQVTGFVSLGFDLDPDGGHTIEFSTFYTRKQDRVVQLREDGFLPGFDYSALAAKQLNGDQIDRNSDFDGFATNTSWISRSVRPDPTESASRGPLWSTNFSDSRSFSRDRDLLVFQLNGEHEFVGLEGLRVTWAANHAETSQDESYLATRFFFEPSDTSAIPSQFPSAPAGPGNFATNTVANSANAIDERQNFGRLDGEYETDVTPWLALTASAGFWYEHGKRDVASNFLQNPRTASGGQFAILGATPFDLGYAIPAQLTRGANGDFAGLRTSQSGAHRKISAFGFALKGSLWEKLDLFGGIRRERVHILSSNDPFTGEFAFDGSPSIFPTKYLMFDRLDNPARGEVGVPPPPGTTFNDQLLGIETVASSSGLVDLVDRAAIESLVNGDIDEVRVLPSAGLNYKPVDGLSLRLAYSQTAARPSFRELGYYVNIEPGSDDLIVGNPQLQISDVKSYDARAEYMWGDLGDLVAVSVFHKKIDRPLESIVIRDPTNFEGSSAALYRTFFNNPNDAALTGVELEGRKAFDFFGIDVLEVLSLGANFTYIDASVDRTEIELARAADFFGTAAGDQQEFGSLKKSRRLFSQPEWIANADLTFDNIDSGTRLTLAVAALSDVLDAAGSATLNSSGSVVSFTLDRYLAAYYQLDLIGSQELHLSFMPGAWTLKASVKNLTDSERKLIYDKAQTVGEVAERSYRLGRDVSLSLTYEYDF